MALSGSFTTSQYTDPEGYKLNYKFSWTATQSIANNTTTISWSIVTEYTDKSSYIYGHKLVLNINNESVINSADISKQLYNGTVVASGTKTITHDNEGKASLSVELQGGIYYYSTINTSGSGSWTLDTIARASTIISTSANIGDAITITVDRKSTSFTHTITYAFGSLSGTIATKSSNTTINYTLPTTFYAQIPNAKSGSGTLYCKTYSGDTQIGDTKSATFNAYVNESTNKPTLTITAVDTDKTLATGVTTTSLTGSTSKIIRGYSNVAITSTETAKNSATISNSYVTCSDGQRNGANNFTFYNVYGNVFTKYATDSRGISNSLSTTLTMINYNNVKVTSSVLERETQTSSTIKYNLNGTWFNDSFGSVTNDITLKYRYKTVGGNYGDYTTLTLTKSGSNFSFSNNSLRTDCNYQTAYVFEFVLTDKVAIYTITEQLTKGIPVWSEGETDLTVHDDLYIKTHLANPLIGGISVSDASELLSYNYNALINFTATTSITDKKGQVRTIEHYSRGLLMPANGTDAALLTVDSGGKVQCFYRNANTEWITASSLLGEYVLYNNTSGSNGTITLSDSVSNYTYIEIFYRNSSSYYASTRIYSPTDKKITLFNSSPDPTNKVMYFENSIIYIYGTSITPNIYARAYIIDGTSNTVQNLNQAYIVRVVGYK